MEFLFLKEFHKTTNTGMIQKIHRKERNVVPIFWLIVLFSFILLLNLLLLCEVLLQECHRHYNNEEDDSLCLTDAFKSDTAIECVINVECHQFGLLDRKSVV